jgi:hypothetical protein
MCFNAKDDSYSLGRDVLQREGPRNPLFYKGPQKLCSGQPKVAAGSNP